MNIDKKVSEGTCSKICVSTCNGCTSKGGDASSAACDSGGLQGVAGNGRARQQGGVNTSNSVDCGAGNCSSSDGRKACSRACKGDTTDLTRDVNT